MNSCFFYGSKLEKATRKLLTCVKGIGLTDERKKRFLFVNCNFHIIFVPTTSCEEHKYKNSTFASKKEGKKEVMMGSYDGEL